MTAPKAAPPPGMPPGVRAVTLLMTLFWTCLVLFYASQGELDQALLWALVGLTSTGSVVAASATGLGRRARVHRNPDGTPRVDEGGS